MILFIGNYTNDDTYREITENGVRDLSQAARLFQERFIIQMGEKKNDFRALSIIPSKNGLKIPSQMEINGIEIETVCLNQSKLSQYKKAMTEVSNWVKQYLDDTEKTNIIMYAVNPIALIPLLKLKKKYNITLTTICPELPQYRRYRKNIKNIIKRRILCFGNEKFDKYILFSEAMSKYISSEKDKYILEGFAPEKIYEPKYIEKNIAMYAGGLASDNGIKLMIEVANKSKNLDELWICGSGDYQKFVEQNVNKKIKYFGKLENHEVIELERKAKVLLNLRNPENPLTRFSFPSKIMEYMASGTIVLSTRLQGISEEYYEYIFAIDKYTTSSICEKLDHIFLFNEQEYKEFAAKASEFVKTKQASYKISEIKCFLGEKI